MGLPAALVVPNHGLPPTIGVATDEATFGLFDDRQTGERIKQLLLIRSF